MMKCKVIYIDALEEYGRPQKYIDRAYRKEIGKIVGRENVIRISGYIGGVKQGSDIYRWSKWGKWQGKVLEELDRELCKNNNKIKMIFFGDAWMPVIPIIRKMINERVILAGLFHGGYYIEGDFVKNVPGGKEIEYGILSSLDYVFVASEYLARAVKRQKADIKIVTVNGLPIGNDVKKYGVKKWLKGGREIRLCFSHRWSEEKGNNECIELLEIIRKRKRCNRNNNGCNIKMVILTPSRIDDKRLEKFRADRLVEIYYNRTRREYLKRLASCQIIFSAARLETFGVSVAEGVKVGLIPIVPNRACYSEFYSEEYLYNDLSEAYYKIKKLSMEDSMIRIMSKVKAPSDGAAMRFGREIERVLLLAGG